MDLFECISGYGLGAASISLFSRVGGGIFTKAADVGSDLVGKVIAGLEDDSPMNPGVIADNVGDNVGDIAGIGSDIFGSFSQSICATLIISATSEELVFSHSAFFYFPLVAIGTGILAGVITCTLALSLMVPNTPEGVDRSMKWQPIIACLLMTPLLYLCCYFCLPEIFHFTAIMKGLSTSTQAFYCCILGLWGGMAIGYLCNYYTSNLQEPVQNMAKSTQYGPATTIISGLSLGFSSTLVPAIILALILYLSSRLCYMYGIACAATGMVSLMSV